MYLKFITTDIGPILIFFLVLHPVFSEGQNEKLPDNLNLDIGVNAFAIHNDDFGIFFGAGYEHFWTPKFATGIRGQTGINSHRQVEPLEQVITPYSDDYILVTEVNYYAFGIYPRFYQELSDIIYFFADVNIGFEASKSGATFGNEFENSERYLGSFKSSLKLYPGFYIGIKIIGNDLSGSFYFGWEKIDLGRSMNKLDIGQTDIFQDYSKKTEFLQLGFRLSVPLRKQK